MDGLTAPRGLQAVCLCAAWCRSCEAYAPLFAAAGTAWRTRWIDIEDEAELLGDFEVESFPTLLLFDDEGLRFAGPVRPDAGTLQALLKAAAEARGPGLLMEAPLAALLQRLRDHPPPCSVP